MLLLIFLTIVSLDSVNCDSLLARSKANTSKITSLSCIVQREIISSRHNKITSEGIFYYQSPSRFRLNLTSPEEQEIICDGGYLFTRIPKEKEWRIKEIVNPIEGLKDYINVGVNFINFLQDEFNFNLKWQGKIKDYNVYLLEGTQKSSDTIIKNTFHYSKILIWLDKSTYQPLRFETYGKGESPTTIYVVDSLFSLDNLNIPTKYELRLGTKDGVLIIKTRLFRIKLNPEIPAEIFKVTLPTEKNK